MLFNIDEDTGHRIIAWLVPDNPSVEPSLVAVVGGRERYKVPANDFRALLKSGGLHTTGICGFVIDEKNCPGIGPERDLELFDLESNLLVFRRPRREPLGVRLFHLETQTSPTYALDRELFPLIQMSYASAELVGEEALISIFNIGFSESVFVSGALAYRRYEPYLRTREFRRSILLCDPHRELAARLMRLKALGREGGAGGGWKCLGQEGLITTLVDVDIRDPVQLGRALRAMKDEDFFALADPTTRKLVATSPDEPLDDHHVGLALGILADFDVIGFDDDLDTFVWNVEAILGGATLSGERASDPPGLGAVLAAVIACKPARELVRLDASVLDLARQAIERAAAPGAAGALSQH